MNYIRLAKRTLLMIALISLWAFFQLPNLHFDYNFENFFPKGDGDLEFFKEYREKFTPDTDFLLVGINRKGPVFNHEFLREVDRLTDSLSSMPFVRSVDSPTNISSVVVGPFGPIEVDYIHLDKPELLSKDSVRIYNSENLVGSFFSKDRHAVSLVVNTEADMNKAQSDTLAQALEATLQEFGFDEIHSAGRMTGQLYYIQKMKSELGLFMGISAVLLVVVLWISYRTFWGVWVPITVVFLTAVVLLAIMSITGKPIDMLTAILPTILLVVGVSDIVHILSRYLEELRNGKGKIDALRIAFRQIGLATFLTSFTTAVGFLTLLTVSIQPIRDFGLYTAIGVFIAFLLAFTLLPAILVLRPRPKIADTTATQKIWYTGLLNALLFTIRRRKGILTGSVVVAAVSVVGVLQVKVDNYLLEDLSVSDPYKKDFAFFEKKFAGVRPFEMYFALTDTSRSVLDYEVVKQMEEVSAYLKDRYGAGFLISPVSFVKSANQAMNGGQPEQYKIPGTKSEYQKLKPLLMRMQKTEQFQNIVAGNGYEARFTGKMNDLGGHRIKQLNQKLRSYFDEHLDKTQYHYRLTGTALLIDKNNRSLASDIMTGLFIAFMVVAVIMGILYRSAAIVLISLLPNMIPLLLIGGIMGFTGIDLKVSTAIIFTIAFGIAVDDTIHFMSKLKLELNKGRSLLYAVKRTYISTGKAILVTSIILCTGFISLIFSTFASTFYIGLLVSATLLFAVLADLLLLPVLLINFYKPKRDKFKS